MKLLIDAQLPWRVVRFFELAGHNAIHTLSLPDANKTTDGEIIQIAEREKRVVVTKDADFVDSHLLYQRPAKLLLISTGNIGNADLDALLTRHIHDIINAFAENDFIEVTPIGIFVRE
jgi:predicted nuclease of predicted toxin-antitoxin system